MSQLTDPKETGPQERTTDASAAAVLDYSPEPGTFVGKFRKWLRTPNPKYRAGTLTYTGYGLLMLFIWLLWGDFCYSLLEDNLPNVIPLKLKEIGAGDATNSVLKYGLSYTIVFFLAPIISTQSDRTRTRWGRRIPYLFWSAPFMGAFLILIGCYQEFTNLFTGGAAQTTILGMQVSGATMAVVVMGILIVGSDLAGIFANTTYYYLFNDVVPENYISRFFAFYRMVGAGAGMAYNEWILPNSMTHFRTIFIISGIAYIVGFALMCYFVREGEYPPPPKLVEDVKPYSGFFGRILNFIMYWSRYFAALMSTYARECFTHKLYWYFFLSTALFYASKLVGMFVLIRNTKSLGLSLQDIGRLGTITIAVSFFLQYPAGWVADKFHPLRVYVFCRIWDILSVLGACVWIFKDFGPQGNLTYMYVLSFVFMPLGLVANAAELPMYMRILPREKYGQFCSANAMVRAAVMAIGAYFAGAFIASFESGWGERRYTLLSAWQLVFQTATAVFLILLYKQWKLHGGNTNYIPPGTIPQPVQGFDVITKENGEGDAAAEKK